MVAGVFLLILGLFAFIAAGTLARRVWRMRTYVAVPGRIRTDGQCYEYVFRGTAYTRDRAADDPADVVTVYVNPADPTDAVLTRAGYGLTVAAAATGVLAVLIGTALVVD
ncbi:DUF3592 domain-containing protein [Mycobacterium sp. C31M]